MKTIKENTLITVENVEKRFGEKVVLKDISLNVSKGEIVTILGPNGAGKSTLLKVLAGVVPPSGGKVVRAKDLKISYLSQGSGCNDTVPMTVRRLLLLSGNKSERDMQKALKLLKIEGLINEDFHTLSGGQVQRALLCRCILRGPDLLILDEPTLNLDFEGRIDFYRLLARIKEAYGCAILIVSHDLHLVMSKSDKVLCLNHHICCQGKPESIRNHPSYAKLFPYAAAKAEQEVGVYMHHHNHKHPLCEGGGK